MLSDIRMKFFLLIPFWSLVTIAASPPSSEFILSSGTSFKMQLARDDLLAGVPFESNLDLAAGDLFKLTDGLGRKTNTALRPRRHRGLGDYFFKPKDFGIKGDPSVFLEWGHSIATRLRSCLQHEPRKDLRFFGQTYSGSRKRSL